MLEGQAGAVMAGLEPAIHTYTAVSIFILEGRTQYGHDIGVLEGVPAFVPWV